MAGRGRGLLQALKEKKEEKAAEEIPSVSSPVESPKLPRSTISSNLEQPTAPSSPKIMPRSIGRGLITSLISKQVTRSTVSPPPVVEKGTEEVTQSPVKEIIKEIQTESVLISEEPKPSLNIARGRGNLVSKLVKPTPKPGESEVPRPAPVPLTSTIVQEVETQITSTLKSIKIDETVTTTLEKSLAGSIEEKTKKSSASTETKYMSVATVSTKASDELKVEHILRKSPVRKSGTAGVPEQFGTNYIKLKCKNKGVYQYVVQYNPPVDSQFHRIRLLYQLKDITGPVRLFDGYTLFLPICLQEKITTRKVPLKPGETEEVEIKIQLTKILPPEQIPPTVFNIIFKNIMKELKMNRIGQHYFSPQRQINVSTQNLQIWPGYTTAVHEYEDGLYLVLDVAHKVLRTQTCWHLMNDLYSKYADQPNEFKDAVFNSICGSVVLTKYNNKTYKVDDILWDQNPDHTFAYHNGEEISYYDYYKKHYDIEIKDRKQPLLFHRAKSKEKQISTSGSPPAPRDVICLIPELCFLTGLNDELRKDFNVKKDLAGHTRLSPEQRFEQLEILIDKIRKTPDALKHITNWGLELDDSLTPLEGRVLPYEKIYFAKKEFETDYKCDWTKPAGNEMCINGVELKYWLIVYPNNKEHIVSRFCDIMYQCGDKSGIRVSQPITVPLSNDKPDTYYNEIKRALKNHIQMVVAIFPALSDSRYTRVKRLCCIELPVPSQVIVIKTINKPDNQLRSVAQKIVLQMNVKLGGELWRLAIPLKKLMVVGIDVYHKTEKKYKSIAGFVSSLNDDQTRWYSRVCFQMTGQELADTLKTAFLQSLKKFQEVNGCLPEKIFIYRDGVSDGQIPIVSEHEVAQLRSCFTADYNPKLSVIIVQKRISTRVFAQAKVTNRIVNPSPATIIDHSITSKDLYDFYLVSQHVNQGTVTPTHYVVAYDDTGFKPDYLQRISYKMTHLYYNWSGTIRVPAPCQYAHKLAFLTGQYLHEETSEALCNRLFYL